MDKYLSRSVVNLARSESIVSGKSDDFGADMTDTSRDYEESPTFSAASAPNASLEERVYGWLATIFPCLLWLRTYSVKAYLKPDLIAGFTVGTMIIPQVDCCALLLDYAPRLFALPCAVLLALNDSFRISSNGVI